MNAHFQAGRRIDRDGLKAAAIEGLSEIVETVKGPPLDRKDASWRFKGGAGFRIAMRGPKAGLWTDGSEGGDVFSLWTLHTGLNPKTDWRRFAESLAGFVGYQGAALAPVERDQLEARRRARQEREAQEQAADDARKADERGAALEAFQSAALPLTDPGAAPALRYLAGRGLTAPAENPDLRFIPAEALPRLAGVRFANSPALLLLCRDHGGAVVAAQRIIILPDGSDRDRDKDKPYTGRAAHHPFRLAPRDKDATGGTLCMAEGFESALGREPINCIE